MCVCVCVCVCVHFLHDCHPHQLFIHALFYDCSNVQFPILLNLHCLYLLLRYLVQLLPITKNKLVTYYAIRLTIEREMTMTKLSSCKKAQGSGLALQSNYRHQAMDVRASYAHIVICRMQWQRVVMVITNPFRQFSSKSQA